MSSRKHAIRNQLPAIIFAHIIVIFSVWQLFHTINIPLVFSHLFKTIRLFTLGYWVPFTLLKKPKIMHKALVGNVMVLGRPLNITAEYETISLVRGSTGLVEIRWVCRWRWQGETYIMWWLRIRWWMIQENAVRKLQPGAHFGKEWGLRKFMGRNGWGEAVWFKR